MDHGPLVDDEIQAGWDLVRRVDEVFPVKAAFWLKLDDRRYRYLYIASDQIRSHNIDVAYGEITRLTMENPSPYLDPFRVKLVGSDDPLARAAAAVAERYPGCPPIRYSGESFGGVSVDDVTVYPPLVPAAA